MTPMNAAETLLAHGDPAHSALVCGGASLSYAELLDAVARAGAAWRSFGLGVGERVALRLPDGIDAVVAYLGTIWAGGVAVAVNPRIPDDEWRTIVGEAGFRFVLAEDAGVASLALERWRGRLAESRPAAPMPMAAEAPAFWSHSSGTSGRPKAVVHAHRFARQVERVAAERLGVTRADRLYASSKMFFVYPLGNSLFAGLKLGATVILDPAWPSAESVAATIAAQRPSVLFSVPSLYRNLLALGLAPRAGTHALRAAVSAGEALPAGLRESWRRATGVALVDGYGASETLGLVLIDRDGAGFAPAPGVSVAPPAPADPDQPTRLAIEGPTLAIGYWNRPDADAEHFLGGRFCPADLFAGGEQGRWRFAGREDSLVKLRGRWVDLIRLAESLSAACPAVGEAAAVVLPDADGVAELALCYTLGPGAAPGDALAALQAAAASLPPYQRPHRLRELPALPRTATGKLLRRRLQDLLAEAAR